MQATISRHDTEGRTFWTVIIPQARAGYEAHITLNEQGRYLVTTRSRQTVRRTFNVFETLETATNHVNRWADKQEVAA